MKNVFDYSILQRNYTPVPPEGGYTVLPLSVCPKYLLAHFSQQLLMAEI
jgi:hypothetical protein